MLVPIRIGGAIAPSARSVGWSSAVLAGDGPGGG
jgi:hypothetical protein